MTNYTVTAERSGKWWSLQCVEVPGAVSQVVRLDQAADIIREAIAFVADVPEEEIEITVTPILPSQVRASLDAAEEFRRSAAAMTSKAAASVRQAADLLHREGLTHREIGIVLGISHQRVNQILKKSLPAQHMDPEAAIAI